MSSTKIVISISSVEKGHHVYNYEYEIGETFMCFTEYGNQFISHWIVVKAKSEETIGHIPDSLANILRPLLKDGIISGILKIENQKKWE